MCYEQQLNRIRGIDASSFFTYSRKGHHTGCWLLLALDQPQSKHAVAVSCYCTAGLEVELKPCLATWLSVLVPLVLNQDPLGCLLALRN